MDEGSKGLFELVGEIFDKLPSWLQVVFGMVIMFLMLAIGIKYVTPLLKQMNFLKKKKPRLMDVRDHSVFTQLNYWINHKCNNLQFGDRERNEIFRRIVLTKLGILNKYMENVARDSKGRSKQSKAEFKNAILTEFTDNIRKFDEEIHKELGQDIFEVVIDSERGFNQWDEREMIYTKSQIELICESDMYDDNSERLLAIFNVYQSAMDSMILLVEKTFRSFNGELEKVLEKLR